VGQPELLVDQAHIGGIRFADPESEFEPAGPHESGERPQGGSRATAFPPSNRRLSHTGSFGQVGLGQTGSKTGFAEQSWADHTII